MSGKSQSPHRQLQCAQAGLKGSQKSYCESQIFLSFFFLNVLFFTPCICPPLIIFQKQAVVCRSGAPASQSFSVSNCKPPYLSSANVLLSQKPEGHCTEPQRKAWHSTSPKVICKLTVHAVRLGLVPGTLTTGSTSSHFTFSLESH